VKLEKEEVALSQDAELGAPGWPPEIHLVDGGLGAQKVEPFLVRDAGVDIHRPPFF
jgi:hypothetical protein